MTPFNWMCYIALNDKVNVNDLWLKILLVAETIASDDRTINELEGLWKETVNA
jgi:hypothetical protein